MALLNFKYGVQSNLPVKAIIANAGNVYITTDTKKMFVELPTTFSGTTVTATEQYCISDFQLVNWTKSDSVTTPISTLESYPLLDVNTLYITVESATGITAMWRYVGGATVGQKFKAISNSEEITDIISRIDSLETAVDTIQDAVDKTVKRTGDTMTGLLTLSGAPIDNLHAASKQYVDEAKSSAIGSVQGANTDTAAAVTIYGAKKYTEEQISIINTTLNDLEVSIGNLSNIMNFLGVTTTILSDGDSINTIVINDETITATAGDVVVVSNSIIGDSTVGDFILSEGKEFVFDGSIWHEIGDTVAQSTAISNLQDEVNEIENKISSLTGKMTTAETDIDNLQAWKESHNTAYTNLESRVGVAETNITNLQNTVGARPSSPTMDTTLWEEVADLRNDLGESSALAGSTTAFARIKTAETMIGASTDEASATGSLYARIAYNTTNIDTHGTAISKNTGDITENKKDIANIITLLTWGTF